MTARILVAGVGNVFFGDDAFGVEVVRRLVQAPLPMGVIVEDYGIRGIHLAYRLLDPLDVLIVVDITSRGGAPGTLYVLEPDLEGGEITNPDAHGMDLGVVFSSVRAMGGTLPRVLIIGCEPQDVTEQMGLSPPVDSAVEPAVTTVREVVERELRRSPAGAPMEIER